MHSSQNLKETLIRKFEEKDATRILAEKTAAELTSKETEDRFTAFFGQKPDKTEGSKAFFADVILSRSCYNGGGWAVVKFCPKCKKEQTGSAHQTLEAIGEAIKKQDSYCYGCNPSLKVEPPVEDKLFDALRDFISEYGNND